MILESSDNSMRDDGNKAAHKALLGDCAESVLEATLTKVQSLLGLGNAVYTTLPTANNLSSRQECSNTVTCPYV